MKTAIEIVEQMTLDTDALEAAAKAMEREMKAMFCQLEAKMGEAIDAIVAERDAAIDRLAEMKAERDEAFRLLDARIS